MDIDLGSKSPNVTTLMSGYLHEDSIAKAARSMAPCERSSTFRRVRSVLTVHDEDALHRLLLRFDNRYPYVEHAGFSPGMWFEAIATRTRMG